MNSSGSVPEPIHLTEELIDRYQTIMAEHHFSREQPCRCGAGLKCGEWLFAYTMLVSSGNLLS